MPPAMNSDARDPTTLGAWPSLPLEAWEDTRATLHLWTQMVGKTRLALSVPENHVWHVALYLTSRGLGTSPIPYGTRTFDVEFDFVAHQLVGRASDGARSALALEPRPMAEFFDRYRSLLRSLGVEANIRPMPCEIPNAIPFSRDRTHESYDPEAANRFWRVLVQAHRVLMGERGRFIGKCSPVHFWWGAMDLAFTRFSGRPAPRHPGGIPNLADRVTRDAYSNECMSVGWWPGNVGAPIAEPAFYAYAYPEPAGFAAARVGPVGARYDAALKEWVLPYEVVRRAANPDAALTEFAHSAYEAAAALASWDRQALER